MLVAIDCLQDVSRESKLAREQELSLLFVVLNSLLINLQSSEGEENKHILMHTDKRENSY